MFAYAVFAFVLMVIAWMMYSQHQDTLKQLDKNQDWDAEKRQFLLSQVIRRKKVTYTLVLIAIAFMVGPFVKHPIVLLVYWSVVILMVFGMVVLAGIDVFATKNYLLSLRDQRIATRRALQEEAKRMRERHAAKSTNDAED